MNNDTPNKTCVTCKFYRDLDYGFGRKSPKMCEGPAAMYVVVTVDDDSNLDSSFRPPTNFGCNGWMEKDLTSN